MKQIFDKIKKAKPSTIFIALGLILLFISLLYVCLNNGEPMKTLMWNAETGGIFPDFYESLKDARYLNPYGTLAIYPPLVYVILFPISKLIISSPFYWNQTPHTYNFVALSTTQSAIIVGVIFFLLVTLATLLLFQDKSKFSNKKLFLFAMIFLCSPGFVFLLDRGNILLIAVIFLFIFLNNYESKSKVKREISIIGLVAASCFKIYPAIFGMLLLIKKRFKDIAKCFAYGIVLFIVPFMLVGGYKAIPKFIDNIATLNENHKEGDRGFGYGYKLDLNNFIEIGQAKIHNNTVSTIFKIVVVVGVAASLIFITVFAKEEWMKVAALSMIMIFIPGFSYIYTAVYMILPVSFFFNERKKINRNTLIYIILFVLIFAPLPYGYVLNNAPGKNKLSYSTLVIELSLLAMTAKMLYDVALTKFKHSKKRGR
ncbi:MAG: glycosyltransferase 87 family protein [Bacilli bacterium]|nr:glycosyltransferase 87 family protein [Bacilli bacterium]